MEGSSASAIPWRASSISARRLLQFLAGFARELRAVPRFDGGRRLATRAMHHVRAGEHADDHQVALVLVEFGEVVGQGEQDFGAPRDIRHQAKLLGQSGQIERLGADGELADDLESLGGALPGNPQEGPAGRAADGVIFQGDEPGEGGQNGGIADLTQQGEGADHQSIVGIL